MIEKINEYILCLAEERFYDAHEALEEIWFPRRFEDNDEMKLMKGFINAAVSFELRKKNKIPQSKKVWKNYLKYRPLLYKVRSPYLNNYHALARYVERINTPKLQD
ncbi:DUF309 domain-containing protein [Sulfurimonas sp. SAG-AH-194-I05]|nr:DUF309 domain-containing protein [Sulfurimonas sp. SAG-AH-194-I05]MDF1875257.1 DUF309 domain-containing protein [Sulfurimonas sp. SAG-AH-194-I05]